MVAKLTGQVNPSSASFELTTPTQDDQVFNMFAGALDLVMLDDSLTSQVLEYAMKLLFQRLVTKYM